MSYDNNQQNQPKVYPKGFMDFPKLGLRTRNRSGEFARLLFGVRESKPTVTLMTGNRDSEDRKGIVSITLDHSNYAAFMRAFAMALVFVPTAEAAEFKASVQSFRPGGQDRREQIPDARLAVGRDREGEIWMGVFKDGHEDIKFVFRAEPNFKWYIGGGEEMSKRLVSELYAGGWLDNLNKYMPLHVQKFFDEAHLAPKKPNGGYSGQGNGRQYGNSGSRSGGNYNRNAPTGAGNDGGGYSRQSDRPSPKNDNFGDDLPF